MDKQKINTINKHLRSQGIKGIEHGNLNGGGYYFEFVMDKFTIRIKIYSPIHTTLQVTKRGKLAGIVDATKYMGILQSIKPLL